MITKEEKARLFMIKHLKCIYGIGKGDPDFLHKAVDDISLSIANQLAKDWGYTDLIDYYEKRHLFKIIV